jgi:uncharacterized GH25 family protein
MAAVIFAATAAHADDAAPKGTLSGTVVNPDGKPVAGARVSVSTAEFDSKTLTSSTKTLAEVTTDGQGHFRLGPIEPVYRARYDFQIDADGFAPQYVPDETYSVYAGGDTDLGHICVYRGRVISGQVLDVDGKPRAGAAVRCQFRRHYLGHTVCQLSPDRTMTTDADGRFRTPPLPVASVTLCVQEPERRLTWINRMVGPGGEEILAEPMRLENDAPVAGVIKDEEGRPIEGATIRANSDYRAVSDPQGKFHLRGFGPNPHFQVHIAKEGYVFVNRGVQVSEQGFTWHDVQSDDNKPHGPDKEFSVVMKRQAWIEGRALDAETGEPVRLDKLVLCTFERKPNGEIVRAGCKNSNFEQPETGLFRVPYSIPMEYTLTFSAAGYHDAETFTPLVKELQPISGITVKMKKDKDGAKPEIQKQRFAGTVTRGGQVVKNGWVGLWALRRPFDTMNAHIMRGRTATGDPIAYSSAPIQDGTLSRKSRARRSRKSGRFESRPTKINSSISPASKVAASVAASRTCPTPGKDNSGSWHSVPPPFARKPAPTRREISPSSNCRRASMVSRSAATLTKIPKCRGPKTGKTYPKTPGRASPTPGSGQRWSRSKPAASPIA